MFALRITFFLLAITACILSVTAHPVHGHARRSHKGLKRRNSGTCTRKSATSSATATATTDSESSTASATSTVASVTSTTTHSTHSTDESSTSTKKTSSGSSTTSSKSTSATSTVKGLLKELFPVQATTSWTTSTSSDDALPLSDSTFHPEKVLSGLTHTYMTAPDGSKSMRAHYPAGSYNFQHDPKGGFSFYSKGPSDLDLTDAKEATFGYSVYFPEGYDFVEGGKLPGLYGGDDDDIAVSCSGGRRDTRCFSVRLMWRSNGKGELYTYLPSYEESGFEANKKQCNVVPESDCNPTYGASVGRGAFKFATGGWTTISQRVRLNSNGNSDGEMELFVNGKSVINVSGLRLTDSSSGRLRGMQMQTFFGGSSPDFATPKTQDAFFKDFSLAITEKL